MAAIANIVRTIFSPSPTHFEVRVDAEMLMKVDLDWAAIAFPSKVLPVPGGPKNIIPLGGARIPLKMSGRSMGQIMTSLIVFLANSSPAMSSQVMSSYRSMISFSTISTMRGSKFLYRSSCYSSGRSAPGRPFSPSLVCAPFTICWVTERPGWNPPDCPPDPGP